MGWSSGPAPLKHVATTSAGFLSLLLTSAPALLAGFVLAGLMTGLLDPLHVGRIAEGPRWRQALGGVAFGLPLPVCSCGVVPMYRSLILRGAPLTAALAFLVATPELGLDAVLLSVPLLGVPLTVARVVTAFFVSVAVALWVGWGSPEASVPESSPSSQTRAVPVRVRVVEGMRFGLVDVVDHTLPWIVMGLLLAALAEPLLGHDLLIGLPSVVQVPLAAVIGVPLYVCASGATPLAAMAAHKGVSSGAALAFLLAGPATNVTTFGMLSALHGRGLAIRFGLSLTLLAMVAGWSVDVLGIAVPPIAHPSDHGAHGHGIVSWISAVGVGLLGAASLLRQGARGFVRQITDPVHAH